MVDRVAGGHNLIQDIHDDAHTRALGYRLRRHRQRREDDDVTPRVFVDMCRPRELNGRLAEPCIGKHGAPSAPQSPGGQVLLMREQPESDIGRLHSLDACWYVMCEFVRNKLAIVSQRFPPRMFAVISRTFAAIHPSLEHRSQ